LQYACAEDGNTAARVVAAASAIMVFFMGLLSGRCPFGAIIHPKSLRDL
jgi:hypothetical protein